MKRNRKMEVLAPAGTYETLRAVIRAGADAVYLGGPAFGARAYAGNFTKEELLDALDYAHLRGVKIYLTVNTLLKNEEIAQVCDYLLPFYERGLDAVLVQDFGVLQLIHDAFPDLPIHTSTQMTVTGPDGVRFLQQYGVTRVVMAREVSLAEMKRIHQETGIELEAFVHGALCYCYSGQCLFSSILGGRSGNRGRCAQPCRLPYTVTDRKGHTAAKETYCLSLKDMCGIRDLRQLQESGVYSLKIEGRMKSADYASGVVSWYRKYVDLLGERGDSPVRPADMEHLTDLGSRCGFTDTYYHAHNGKEMVTFDKPNFASRNPAYHEEITVKYVEKQDRIPIDGYMMMQRGMPVVFSLSLGDRVVTVTGPEPMEAQKKPLQQEEVEERLRKTGASHFEFRELTLDMAEGIFLPNGVLNQIRRDGLDQLQEELLQEFRRTAVGQQKREEGTPDRRDTGKKPELICEVTTPDQLEAVMDSAICDVIYADSHLYPDRRDLGADLREAHGKGKQFYLVLPPVFRCPVSDRFCRFLESEAFARPDGFVVKNYEELYLIRTRFPEAVLVTDHNLYAWNDLAVEGFRKAGADRVTMPLELNGREIAGRRNDSSEMILYGYYPLMVTAGCVHRNTEGCDHRETLLLLKDRYRTDFPVRNLCSDCCNIIYNSLPTCLLDRMGQLRSNQVTSFRLSFTLEDRKRTLQVLDLAGDALAGRLSREKLGLLGNVTNGHYKRGVE